MCSTDTETSSQSKNNNNNNCTCAKWLNQFQSNKTTQSCKHSHWKKKNWNIPLAGIHSSTMLVRCECAAYSVQHAHFHRSTKRNTRINNCHGTWSKHPGNNQITNNNNSINSSSVVYRMSRKSWMHKYTLRAIKLSISCILLIWMNEAAKEWRAKK